MKLISVDTGKSRNLNLNLNPNYKFNLFCSPYSNGEFEMTTSSTNNSYVKNGFLHIVPTLTSDVIGEAAVRDGFTYNITGCTSGNTTDGCGAVSNITAGTVINPVMSARITTKQSHHIQYGKVEIRAKLPRGDWIWPALWMLPVNDDYGPWPQSGEIDIMESRGNGPDYKAQYVPLSISPALPSDIYS